MDLMGQKKVESLDEKRYVYVVVDNFSRFTWVNFIKEKSDTFEVFRDLCECRQRENDIMTIRIRSDHGKEFEKNKFVVFFLLKESVINFHLPLLLSKMGLWNAKTDLFRNLPEL